MSLDWSVVAQVVFSVLLLALTVYTFWVCEQDARRRGKSPLLVCLLILISFPLGLFLWLIFRPPPVDRGSGPSRLDDHRVP